MLKILFICLDDEDFTKKKKMVMRDLISKAGLEEQITADSAGINASSTGKTLKDEAKAVLAKNGITATDHTGQCFFEIDYNDYDLLIVLDRISAFAIKRRLKDTFKRRIYLLMQMAGEQRDVSDPFDTHEDDSTFNDITLGCNSLMEKLLQANNREC